jgi:hypothetical protein
MNHFGTGGHAGVNAPEWLKVGTAVSQLVNEWSLRSDLIVRIGPNESAPAPALYNPALSEVEVNTVHAFGPSIEPALVGDLTDRDTQFDWPKATGAIFHEALHARFTRFSLQAVSDALTPGQLAALHLLEESRIEGLGARAMPSNRGFLRACALEIVLADLSAERLAEEGHTRGAAHVAGLTLARVDAGVLDRSDVETVAEYLESFLGEELLEKLRNVWIQFQAHLDHSNHLPLLPLAIEWDRLVTEASEERGEPQPGATPSQEVLDAIRELLERLEDDAAGATIGASDELGDQQQSEEWAKEVDAKGKDSRQRQQHVAASAKVFDKGTGPGASSSKSTLSVKRQPTGEERAAAVQVARLLEKAKYRDRSQTDVTSATPPGRLRTGAMVQAAALKVKGVRAQTEPWRATKRKHTEDPELKVGVMVDISGSMGSAMEPMAVTAWVMSEAVHRIQGKTSMVYYGNDVFATLKPGQHLREINVYTAPDGTEKFDAAFKALDGSMNLLQGSGARLLVVVSDGEYTSDERIHAKKWMRDCDRAGVAILWIKFDSRNGNPDVFLNGTSGEVVVSDGVASKVAKTIGEAAAKALTRAGARQAR